MIALNLLESATLNTPRFFRRYEGEADNEVSMDKLIVVTGGEGRLLNERFSGSAETGDEAASETEKQVGKLRAAGEEALLSWEPFPARIGRVSTRYRGNAVLFHEEPAPLADQLEALRERKPGKRHFRIAVINGFGGNLGDNIVGMTAMREAAKVLGEHLPSFSVDILFGPDNREACADLLHEPWMERISYLAPTVREFASYDAYFDFLNLITSPKYNTMPSTDWYLWWLGLDPVAVPVGNKRNRMALRWKEWHEVETLLRKAGGTKRVLFNPKASVPLRSMPEDVAVKLVKQLLDLDTSLSIVLDRPLPMEHRRVFSLGDAITSPELHKALVAQMQGVISVNTLTPHAADAASVPCVQLCTVYPPEMYPYYRYARNLNVPGFETLPAFRRPKVSEEEWKGMEAAYHEAWKGVKAKTVLASLNEAMRRREEAEREPQGLTLVHGIPERRCVTEGADPAFFARTGNRTVDVFAATPGIRDEEPAPFRNDRGSRRSRTSEAVSASFGNGGSLRDATCLRAPAFARPSGFRSSGGLSQRGVSYDGSALGSQTGRNPRNRPVVGNGPSLVGQHHRKTKRPHTERGRLESAGLSYADRTASAAFALRSARLSRNVETLPPRPARFRRGTGKGRSSVPGNHELRLYVLGPARPEGRRLPPPAHRNPEREGNGARRIR